MAELIAAEPAALLHAPKENTAIAPWWHTLLLLAALGMWAYFSKLRTDHLRSLENIDRMRMYLRTMTFEWLLLGFVLLGLWLRKVPYRAIFGERWRAPGAFAKDLGLGVLFLIFSLVNGAVFGPHGHGGIDAAVRFMLPLTAAEKAMWILLSLTAGICEEAVFRGYLQQQFRGWSRSAAFAIILQALLFGAVHAYQGFLRTIPIVTLGLLLGVLSHWRKSVRPGMITHFLQDSLALFAGR